MIDPYFMLSDSEDADLRAAVERFTGAETERAIFAVGAPVWVSNVAQSFQFDPASTNDLLDALTVVRTDGYMAGINAGLTAHGRDPLTDITDPALLRQIQLDTADAVNSATKTWNADASAAAWRQWSSIKDDPSLTSDADRQAALYGGMLDWRDGRMQWKGDQWTQDNASAGLFDAAKTFQQENQTATVGWIEPRDAVCVLPDCRVVPIGRLEAAMRSWYEGPVICLATASGVTLRVTPKHPVLTGRGWLAAEDLREGDHVFRVTSSRQRESAVDADSVPPMITDVFGSLVAKFAMARDVGPQDFHGDGTWMQGKVEVVSADAQLGGEVDFQLAEKVLQLALALVLSRQPLLASLCSAEEHPRPLMGITHIVGRGEADGARGRIGTAVAQPHACLAQPPVQRSPVDPQDLRNSWDGQAGFIQDGCAIHVNGDLPVLPIPAVVELLGSSLDSGAPEVVIEQLPTDPSLSRERGDRGSCSVTPDEIIEVRNDPEGWHGFVYNLQTSAGCFVADGIIVHNCQACNDAIDLGDETDPVDADTLLQLEWPLHAGCDHNCVLQQIDVPADQSLWGENLGPQDGGGNASSSGDEAAA